MKIGKIVISNGITLISSEISNLQIGNGNVMINGKNINRKIIICRYCGGKKFDSEKCEGCGAK